MQSIRSSHRSWLGLPRGCKMLIAITTLIVGADEAALLPPPSAQSQAASVEGQVVDATTGRPIAGASVTISGNGNSREALTNGTGQFVFRSLTLGQYQLTARKEGWADGAYGRLRPSGSSRSLNLRVPSADVLVKISIWRHATVDGQVGDGGGAAIADAQITIYKRVAIAGGFRWSPAASSRTDDRGMFRVHWLSPGTYIVSARSTQRLAVSGDTRETRELVFGPRYYPDAASPAAATPIELTAGAQRTLGFQLNPEPGHSVSGQLQGTPAQVVGVALRLSPASTSDAFDDGDGTSVTTSRTDGSFSFSGVLAGQYILKATKWPPLGPGGIRRTTDPTVWATVTIEVADVDLKGISVSVSGGFVVSGRIELHLDASLSVAAVVSGASVVLEPADGRPSAYQGGAAVGRDGAFSTIGVPPGAYAVGIRGLMPGWLVRSVTLEGREITDTPVRVSRAVSNVVITLTNQSSGLQGTVRSRRGAPDDSSSVLIFPEAPIYWTETGSSPRRFRTIRADSFGSYRATNLPPGRYLVLAIAEASLTDWHAASILERLRPIAIGVSLVAGQSTVQDLILSDTQIRPGGGEDSWHLSLKLPAPDVLGQSGPRVADEDREAAADSPNNYFQVTETSISGTVVDAATGQPISGCQVVATAVSSTQTYSAATDRHGRFVLPIVTGQYVVKVSKPGYVAAEYGALQAGRRGSPVVVSQGLASPDLLVRLSRGGVIAGTVLDYNGDPARNVPLGLRRRVLIGTELRLLPAEGSGLASTDDRGQYRFYGLPKGDYLVLALPRFPGGTRALDVTPPRSSDVLRSRVGYVPVFCPGTPDVTTARVLSVDLGDALTDADIQLQLVRVARVEGRVTGPSEGWSQVVLNMSLASEFAGATPAPSLRMNPQGSFEAIDVFPGAYVITAEARSNDSSGGFLWALVDFTVAQADVAGLDVPLRPTAAVYGTVTAEPSVPIAKLGPLHVTLEPLGPVSQTQNREPTSRVDAQAGFKLNGVRPGKYRLNVSGLATFAVKSAVVAGRETIDDGFEITASSEAVAAKITLTRWVASIQGNLQNASGQSTSDFFVVIFSSDRSHWSQSSRRTLFTRPATNGGFRFGNVPPGEYYLVALRDFEPTQLRDPKFLEQLVPAALKLLIREGELITQNVGIRKVNLAECPNLRW